MNLFGGKVSEIVGLMNAVARDPNTDWSLMNGQYVKHTTIAGISLRMRKIIDFNTMLPKMISITGKGWMVSFHVNKQRPRSLKDDQWSEKATLIIGGTETEKELVIHTGSIISPDAFRNEMAVLRTFEAMWNRG